MRLFNTCNKIIEYSFYALFLLVPLAFTSATSELFELNKMWLVWALTIIIGMSWFIKMTLQRKFFIQRTPLDIPIALFLFSQIISTIFSLDSHVSLWGYYSRFNGGLLSIISYIFLYYAFLSNFQTNAVAMVKRSLFLSLFCGLIVALWGLPSHFGYDPTCFLFRHTFDVSCWTADFMPKIRIFSTLGQPDWLAAYLAILIPISIAFFISNLKSNSPDFQVRNHESGIMNYVLSKKFIHNSLFIILTSLFYLDLLYTRARSGFLGVWISLIFFFFAYIWIERKSFKSLIVNRQLSIVIGIFLISTFIIGTPINQINRLTLQGLGNYFQKTLPSVQNSVQTKPSIQPSESGGPARRLVPRSPKGEVGNLGEGGTESADIRLLVWSGAINAWKSNPLFGTGVETFAFAYYKYKPATQNLTSEWNFLYNKAHNEYLNYLATTGIFGLGSYLLMIGWFFFISFKKLKARAAGIASGDARQMSKLKCGTQNEKFSALSYSFELCILSLALITSYISILITNFFGFSVVMTNVYLFMIPAFVFVLDNNKIEMRKSAQSASSSAQINTSIWQWTPILFALIIGVFMLFFLFRFWQADMAFALGYNLDRAGEYQQAYPNLHKAVKLRGDEPVFKDELSINDAIIAAGLVSQKPRAAGIASGDARQDERTAEKTISVASSLAQEAINTSNEVISQHPNNAVFWKTRVRLFHTLSQVDSRYLPRALDAIEKASLIAPQDANIWYNLGVLYGQNNNIEKGISAMEKTVILKPDYRDAHFGLGLFYHQKAIDKNGNIIDSTLQKKAIAQMQYILLHISSKDTAARQSIEDWAK